MRTVLPRSPMRHRLALIAVLATVAVLAISPASSAARAAAPGPKPTILGGPITSPLSRAGQWIVDDAGRVAVFHGFNIMYKQAPYYPTLALFNKQDAAFLADNGFNIARLGLIWAGVEPQPGKYDDGLLHHQLALDALMSRYGIRTLVDFHQDSKGSFPSWTGLGSDNGTGQNFATLAPRFWADSAGSDGIGIQTHFVTMWRHVASVLRTSRNLYGYDPINEPNAPVTDGCAPTLVACPQFESGKLADFYRRIIPAIRASDRKTVIWPEAMADSNLAGPPALPVFADAQTAYNVHIYCPSFLLSSGSPQVPTDPGARCALQEKNLFFPHTYAQYAVPHKLPVLVSEFSATDARTDNVSMIDLMQQYFSSWAAWEYKGAEPGDNPSYNFVADSTKVGSDDNVKPAKADDLVVPYAQAIAGVPGTQAFERANKTYRLSYTALAVPGARLKPGSPTQVFIPHRQYPAGYQVHVTNASVRSRPGWPWLEVVAAHPGAQVSVVVTPATNSTTLKPSQVGLGSALSAPTAGTPASRASESPRTRSRAGAGLAATGPRTLPLAVGCLFLAVAILLRRRLVRARPTAGS